ncbi:MAG: hypothetical protein KAT06_04580 [Gammaproteobacteria bacterium]|nr:hypothetical protein [Gammaproteobacteria bacterium]
MTPVEKIVVWVKNKPVWWKHSIRLSLRDGELQVLCCYSARRKYEL